MRKPALAIVLGLLLAAVFAAGYYIGRAKIEREWRLPPATLSEADVARLKVDGADPVPPAGSHVFGPMPLGRAREALRAFTAQDPVKVSLGSIGRSDDGTMDLHLVVENHAGCAITSYGGVAYGFAADGRSARLNKSGEHFVAFSKDDAQIAANEKGVLEAPIKNPETASLAVAQIDRWRCADGTSWARP